MERSEWIQVLFSSQIAELENCVQSIKKNPSVLLHIGCDTGELTAKLRKVTSRVIGTDFTEPTIREAQKRFPTIEFALSDIYKTRWKSTFDIAFSYDVFQRNLEPKLLLNYIYRSLKDDGAFVTGFGAKGNMADIEHALKSVMGSYGYQYQSPFYFPEVSAYEQLLKECGFSAERVEAFTLPTVLPDGRDSLRDFLRQIFWKELSNFRPSVQDELFALMESIFFADNWDGQRWHIQFKHVSVIARKKQ